MMYEFVDTNEHTSTSVLPTEAVSLNGTYLENIIEGYRTLYVKGRESLTPQLSNVSVGASDGEIIKGIRYPARTITVGFQLLCPDAEEFRKRFNQLNNVLSAEQTDFIFNDERDKFFTGYPVMDVDVDAGRNNVVGEWQIYCAYPFKRSVNTVKLSTDDASGVVVDGNTATFTFEYDGMLPAKPVLRAEFASGEVGGNYNEDGDCGFVAFVNDEEDIIQLGNPEATDIDPLNRNATLINNIFTNTTGWNNNGYSIGNISDPHWQNDRGQTLTFAKGVGTLQKTTEGGVSCELDIVHRLCVSSPAQQGTFSCLLKNGTNTVIGFTISKAGNGTTGIVNYILDGRTVGTDSIDLSYYNTHFGYCNKTPVYVTNVWYETVRSTRRTRGGSGATNATMARVRRTRTVQTGWAYTQSNLNSGITRDNNVVTFSIGNLPDRTFKTNDIAGVPFYDMVFQSTGNMDTNAVRSCALIKKKGVSYAVIPNVFTAGDIVEADCNNANVYLYRNGTEEGHLEPQYGALGNDWETFDIKVGTNIIKVMWSDWVNENYKPKISIEYNKVYL